MSDIEKHFQLDQRKEYDFNQIFIENYLIAYVFSRSTSRQKQQDVIYPGDDYFAFDIHDGRLVFAMCDGVSESFGGYVASKFLADSLVNWLKPYLFESKEILLNDAYEILNSWVGDATALISSTPFLLPIIGEKDQKRKEEKKKKGAQTTFVTGYLDPTNNQAIFIWLGDTRVLIDLRDDTLNEYIDWDNNTKIFWSTVSGIRQHPNISVYILSDIKRVIVYTDGLKNFISENDILTSYDLSSISITNPSDDTSLLVIDTTHLTLGSLPIERQEVKKKVQEKVQEEDEHILPGLLPVQYSQSKSTTFKAMATAIVAVFFIMLGLFLIPNIKQNLYTNSINTQTILYPNVTPQTISTSIADMPNKTIPTNIDVTIERPTIVLTNVPGTPSIPLPTAVAQATGDTDIPVVDCNIFIVTAVGLEFHDLILGEYVPFQPIPINRRIEEVPDLRNGDWILIYDPETNIRGYLLIQELQNYTRCSK